MSPKSSAIAWEQKRTLVYILKFICRTTDFVCIQFELGISYDSLPSETAIFSKRTAFYTRGKMSENRNIFDDAVRFV